MPVISGPDLTLLRTQGHKTQFFASFLPMNALWTAQINDAGIVMGEQDIVFDAGSGTNFAAIGARQELWIGTSPGANDVGRLRIRSIVSGDGGVTGTVNVARHALYLDDNDYLTFIHHYPLKPLYPLIVGPPADATFFKDGDVAFTSEIPPVLIAGENKANFIDDTLGYWEITSELPSSYVVKPGTTIASYSALSVPSAGVTISIAGGTGVGFIRFSIPGPYWVHYTIIDNLGVSQVAHRFYYAHSTDPTSPHYPFHDFDISQVTGDWERGGFSTGVKAHDNADVDNIPDKTIGIVWGINYYGETQKNITFLPDETTTIISGYVRKESIERALDTGAGGVDFQIETIDAILKNQYMFSVSLAARSTPGAWFEYFDNLNIRTALHHFWKWHSTLFEVADVFLPTNTDGRAYAEFEDGNLYSMADDMARNKGIRAHVVCDNGGRVHVVQDVQLLPDVERAVLGTVQAILYTDRGGEITIEDQPINRTAFVKTSGFSFDGTFSGSGCPEPPCPNVEPLCASAPGLLPSDEGANVVDFDRQVFVSQTHANQIAGRIFAQLNNPFPEVRIRFHGNYFGVLAVHLSEFWTLSLLSGDTEREIVWSTQKLICRSITGITNTQQGTMLCEAIFEPEATGFDGVAGYCLDELPEETGQDPPAAVGEPEIATGSSVYTFQQNDWTLQTAEATEDLRLDPYWQIKQASTSRSDAILVRSGLGYIKKSLDAGVTWSVVTPATDPPNASGDTPAPTVGDVTFIQFEPSWINSGEWVFLARWQNGSGDWRTWMWYTDDDFSTGSWLSIGGTATCGLGTGYTFGCSDGGAFPGYLVAALSSTLVVTIFEDCAGTQFVRAGSVSGTVITYGTAVGLSNGSAAFVSADYGIAKLSSTSFVIVYNSVSNATHPAQDGYARVGTISGTTITLGTPHRLTRQGGLGTKTLNDFTITCPDSSTVIIASGRNSPNDPTCDGNTTTYYVISGTISGTTITFPTTMCGGNNGPNWTIIETLSSATSNPNNIFIKALSATNWIAAYAGSGVTAGGRVVAGTVSGTSVVVGTPVSLSNTVSTSRIYGIAGLSSTKAVIMYITTSPTDPSWQAMYVVVADISGTTVTLNSAVLVFDGGVDDLNIDGGTIGEYDSGNIYLGYRPRSGTVQCIKMLNASVTLGNVTLGSPCGVQESGFGSSDTLASHPIDANSFIMLTLDNPTNPADAILKVMSRTDIGSCGGGGPAMGIGITIDKYDSSNAWITGLTSGVLTLYRVDLSSLTILDEFSLGSASESDVNNRVYIAYPYCSLEAAPTKIYVYGRMNSPQGLTSPTHLIVSDDGGTSWGAIEDSLGSNHAGAMFVEPDGTISLISCNNIQSKLYRGTDIGLSLLSTLPFTKRVNSHALDIYFSDGGIVVGAGGAGSVMVVRSYVPYILWNDITFDHGVSDDINSVQVIQ